MTRRKGERTAAINEREHPWRVAIPVPDLGLGAAVFDITRLCAWLGVPEVMGRGFRQNDQDVTTRCFADEATAMAFAAKFHGAWIVGRPSEFPSALQNAKG